MSQPITPAGRRWLVILELVTLLLFSLALLFLAAVSYVGFIATVTETGFDEHFPQGPIPIDEAPPPDPWAERALTPVGYLLWGGCFVLPAAFLCGLAILLHRLVVRPLAEPP